MNEIERKKLYKELADFYGERAQCMMCIEEMAELTKELCKFERNKSNYNEIAEETADTIIMIEQIIRIYGIAKEVERIKGEKLQRTKKRLANDIEKYKINVTKSDKK